jgi:acyl-CoA thioester hydrolase
MSVAFTTTHRVEFFETDMAGIVHFANYYRMMESAEHQFFRSLKLQIAGTLPDGISFGWPRISATCRFRAPARYEDVITINVSIKARSHRSLTLTYEFRLDEAVLAEGEMTTVFCRVESGGKLEAMAIPEEVVKVFESVA